MTEKLRGKILEIGTFDHLGYPKGWKFNCSNGVPGINITDNGTEYAGYTIPELMDIYFKRAIPNEADNRASPPASTITDPFNK